jgi:uncharacterized protein YjbJ (UPF0337 family)
MEFPMNSDQFKGGVKEFAGKVQEDLGRFIGSPSQQDKGFDLQNEGRAQVHLGNIKEFGELEIHDREFDKRRDDWAIGRG